MADDTPLPDPAPETPLGLGEYLDEETEWTRFVAGVHRSIARRELSGQAVELGAQGLTGVMLEYLQAVVDVVGGTGGRRRGD